MKRRYLGCDGPSAHIDRCRLRYDAEINRVDHDQPILDIAESLAMALDSDDFETARSLMDPNVVYVIGEHRLVGPEEVVDSYQRASELAHSLFDTVEYDHVVQGVVDEQTVRVSYSDALGVGGDEHFHRAVQDLTIDPARGILEIVDRPVPGEREKLDDFMASHRIEKPNTA